jgi:hypothetical protein
MKQGLIVGISVLIVGLSIVALAWWFWPYSDDPQVVKIKQLQQQIFQQQSSLSDAERGQLFRQLREEMKQLPEQQREQLRREMFEGARERMTSQVKKFAELPPDRRTAFLDEQIDRMESRRRQASQRGAAQSRANAPPGSRGGRRFDGPGGRRNMSQEQRDQRRRERLDGSTARERAQFAAYFEALRKRRQERGLPQFGPLAPPGR